MKAFRMCGLYALATVLLGTPLQAAQPSKQAPQPSDSVPELLLAVTDAESAKVMGQSNFKLRDELWRSKRAQVVRINFDAFNTSDRLSMDPFPDSKEPVDAKLILKKTGVEKIPGGETWIGELTGPLTLSNTELAQMFRDTSTGADMPAEKLRRMPGVTIELTTRAVERILPASKLSEWRKRDPSSAPRIGVVTNPEALKTGAEPALKVQVRLIGGGFRIHRKLGNAIVTKSYVIVPNPSNEVDEDYHIIYEVDTERQEALRAATVVDRSDGVSVSQPRVLPANVARILAERRVFVDALRQEEAEFKRSNVNTTGRAP